MEQENNNIYYHYTSLEALYNIVINHNFRLSYLNYTNDKDEFKVDKDIILIAIDELIEADNYKSYQKIFSKFKEIFQEDYTSDDKLTVPYAISLTDRPDDLFHWAMYGDSKKGINIGIYVNKLIEISKFQIDEDRDYYPFSFNKICYTDFEKINYIKNTLWYWAIRLRNQYDEKLRFDLLGFFLINEFRFFFKNEKYTNENEYRLAKNINEKSILPSFNDEEQKLIKNHRNNFFKNNSHQFIMSHGEIIPYIEFDFKDLIDKDIFACITLGPLCQQNEKNLEKFLKEYGINAKIEKSKIPLRF